MCDDVLAIAKLDNLWVDPKISKISTMGRLIRLCGILGRLMLV